MSTVDKLRAGARSWGLLAGALALGGLAFLISSWYLAQRQARMEQELLAQQGEKRQVVVATVAMQPGETIGGQNMAIAEIPVVNLSDQAVSPEEFGLFEGKVLTTRMSAGEPLLNHFVAGLGAERFSDLLRDGERAVTIEVDELKSNDSMLTFGDRVDLLLMLDDEKSEAGQKKPSTLVPLLENVRVLATGKRALVTREADLSGVQETPDSQLTYSTITVGATAEDAARLLLARGLGDIVVLMRSRTDERPLNSTLISREGLLTGSSSAGGYEFYSGSMVEAGSLRSALRQISSTVPRKSAQSPVPATPPTAPAAAPPLGPVEKKNPEDAKVAPAGAP